MKKKPRKPVITPRIDTFAGVKLEPMTKQREVVAAEMGMRWGFVGTYRPQYYLRDTIIVIWLRTIPVEIRPLNLQYGAGEVKGWCVDRAEVAPDEAMRAALVWAEKMKIGIRSPRFQEEAFPIFVHTMKQIEEAKGEPIVSGDTSDTPDAGEL